MSKALAIDPGMLSHLKDDLEVPEYRAIKALFHTKNDLEEALVWLEEHKNDADIDQPCRITRGGELVAMTAAAAASEGPIPMETDSEATENPQAVKEFIDKEMVEQLTSMGFAVVRAEKALFITKNGGLEAAVNWLSDHQADADIDTPLSLAAVEAAAKAAAEPAKPKLSPEEAQARAYELQRRIREQREAREKQEAYDKEKNRIAMTKAMSEQQEKLKDAERQRAIEQIKREKAEHEAEKQRMREILKRDYEERFGKPYPEETTAEVDEESAIGSKSIKDQVIFWINKMKKLYKPQSPAELKGCLQTLRIYIDNAHKNPTDPKFHKIKKENNAFKTKVAPFEGAVKLLNAVGFKDDGDFYAIQGVPDGFNCGTALKFIDLMLNTM